MNVDAEISVGVSGGSPGGPGQPAPDVSAPMDMDSPPPVAAAATRAEQQAGGAGPSGASGSASLPAAAAFAVGDRAVVAEGEYEGGMGVVSALGSASFLIDLDNADHWGLHEGQNLDLPASSLARTRHPPPQKRVKGRRRG